MKLKIKAHFANGAVRTVAATTFEAAVKKAEKYQGALGELLYVTEKVTRTRPEGATA